MITLWARALYKLISNIPKDTLLLHKELEVLLEDHNINEDISENKDDDNDDEINIDKEQERDYILSFLK
ncbi:1871_t:CDS:2 [Funneliformis mosseae]|uniref:1871_t:CDS:1 n=1 Tax=Funneliformis mosseae TaxID=27381 RepID=A0A9N9GU89_FUNMO|nr:1871_t:CDS:2 [Funneliformis mosseae]